MPCAVQNEVFRHAGVGEQSARTNPPPPREVQIPIDFQEGFTMTSHGFLSIMLSLALMGGFPASGTTASAADNSVPKQDASETVFQNGLVAADHPLASEAGAEILRKGGNVVDAAVATAFALSVLRPASSGIGGGGFMVIWNAKKREAIALDYREVAPAKASRDMFSKPGTSDMPQEDLSTKGHLAAAVPLHVAGLCHALQHYGSLDLPTVLAPAIRLAEQGVPVDTYTIAMQKSVLAQFEKHPEYRDRFAALWKAYLNNGILWKTGDTFHSPQLPALKRIAEFGADGFYQGPVAEAIVAESARGGGLITLQDLASVKPTVRQALRGNFDGNAVLTMPPASSGGIALIEMLNLLTAYEQLHPEQRLERLGHNSPEYVHLLTEVMKHAFADRAEFLGDADFVSVPTARLISTDYAGVLARRILPDRTRPLKDYGRFLPTEDAGTTHFSVMDRHGNAVACTETINTEFGSFVVEPKFGIVLNNEMDDFAAVPGEPNVFGLMQSEANAIQPGKRPLSSMTPTIVVNKDGQAIMAVGASGGPRIISTTLQVLLNASRFQMPPAAAVAKPRFHHQWLPDMIYLEPPLPKQVGRALRTRGHQLKQRSVLAVSQIVTADDDGLRGASDPRKHGQPAGY